MHLQRTLAVDADFRNKWMSAFKQGELACERLGAVHLLSHGLFAFKANAKGEATDLVFAEMPDRASVARSVDGLVLTEWKKATEKDAGQKFEEAKKQADRYTQGVFAGLELAGYRFLICVSQHNLSQASMLPDSKNNAGVIYRHINIAVEPKVASVLAKSK
jgi:hypothetical protein